MIKKFNMFTENDDWKEKALKKKYSEIFDRLEVKVTTSTENIRLQKNLIKNINNILENSDDYELIFNNYDYPKIGEEIDDISDFMKKNNFRKGQLLASFYDPYDNLMETDITITENFIIWERRNYYTVFIKKSYLKNIQRKKFNL